MSDGEAPCCRICGGEDQPLCQPCDCQGSMQFVHETCLRRWLSGCVREDGEEGIDSQDDAPTNARTQLVRSCCEVCGFVFQIIPVYHPEAPARLPVSLLFQHLLQKSLALTVRGVTLLLKTYLWLGIIPGLSSWALLFVISFIWTGSTTPPIIYGRPFSILHALTLSGPSALIGFGICGLGLSVLAWWSERLGQSDQVGSRFPRAGLSEQPQTPQGSSFHETRSGSQPSVPVSRRAPSINNPAYATSAWAVSASLYLNSIAGFLFVCFPLFLGRAAISDSIPPLVSLSHDINCLLIGNIPMVIYLALNTLPSTISILRHVLTLLIFVAPTASSALCLSVFRVGGLLSIVPAALFVVWPVRAIVQWLVSDSMIPSRIFKVAFGSPERTEQLSTLITDLFVASSWSAFITVGSLIPSIQFILWIIPEVGQSPDRKYLDRIASSGTSLAVPLEAVVIHVFLPVLATLPSHGVLDQIRTWLTRLYRLLVFNDGVVGNSVISSAVQMLLSTLVIWSGFCSAFLFTLGLPVLLGRVTCRLILPEIDAENRALWLLLGWFVVGLVLRAVMWWLDRGRPRVPIEPPPVPSSRDSERPASHAPSLLALSFAVALAFAPLALGQIIAGIFVSPFSADKTVWISAWVAGMLIIKAWVGLHAELHRRQGREESEFLYISRLARLDGWGDETVLTGAMTALKPLLGIWIVHIAIPELVIRVSYGLAFRLMRRWLIISLLILRILVQWLLPFVANLLERTSKDLYERKYLITTRLLNKRS